jgi:iron complex outermembrane recepter protein
MLLFAVLLWPVYAAAQFTISGQVVDAANDNTLPGAHVVVEGSYQGVFSDRHGAFSLTDLEAGTYHIRVSFLGYKDNVKEVVLASDRNIVFLLQPSATMTEEVVVSALRAEGQASLAYTDLDAEALAAKNLAQDLPVLLNQTPSLIYRSDAGAGVGYTYMSIRGSDQTRINVTINGIPVNDAESHGVWWVNIPDIASSIQNLQIQRGVGMSTHGAGAFGATINLQSTSLRDETYAEINSAAGAFNTIKNTFSFGSGLINNNWAFDGRLSKINSEGFVDRASADLKSFYLSGGYYGKNTMIKAVAFSGKESTYQAWYGVPSDSLETNRTFNPAGLYVDDEGQTHYYDNETDNYQQDHYQLHMTRNLYSGLIATAALHYTYGKGYYEQFRQNEAFSRYDLPDVEIGGETFNRSDLVRRRWLDNHFYGATWSLKYNNYSGLSLTLGGAYNEYDGDHFGEIIWARHAMHADIRHRYYDNNGFKKDFNRFAKVSYEIIPRLIAFADLQYRYVSYSFLGQAWVHEEVVPLQQKALFHFVNPKAGLSYALNRLNTVYIFSGIGNREPVRRDFTESSPDSRPKHETLRNIETGYQYTGRNAQFKINFYLMDYKDQLVLTGEINDVGGFSRTNIDSSYRMGVELEGGYIFSDFLRWTGNLTLSRNKIDLFEEHTDKYDEDWNWIGTDIREYRDTDIAFSPSVIAASTIQLQPIQQITLSLESKYVGNQYIDNTMSSDRMLDAYLVNDLRLSYTFAARHLREAEIVLQINNLFNHRYSSNAWIYKGVVGESGLITIEDGFFPQAGRHMMLGLNLRF